MKKTLVFVIALVLAMGMMASAATYTADLPEGWNFISVPLVPFDSAVESVFNGFDFMFGDQIQTMLGNVGQAYDGWDPENSDLKNIFIGQGYYFYAIEGGTLSYEGVADGVPDSQGTMADMWISFPAKGWQMVGTPFNHDVYVNSDQSDMGDGDNIFFTDGSSLKNWSEANDAGWVSSEAQGSEGTVGYFFNDSCKFEPGKGYYLETSVDNLAMIVPAY
ncbi:MAG: hypothetical protein J6U98_03300 [Abditibacteriota bacterium]|nr:hypothetical protein [Abditibacteriota bacterium]MBP5093906.1 hypothetical protein [Abditibacteriota bacterium]MBP5738808.1 hypothetical protein [Abditibacteriota bacterium]